MSTTVADGTLEVRTARLARRTPGKGGIPGNHKGNCRNVLKNDGNSQLEGSSTSNTGPSFELATGHQHALKQRNPRSKLSKNPTKPAYIPAPPKERIIGAPRPRMKNVQCGHWRVSRMRGSEARRVNKNQQKATSNEMKSTCNPTLKHPRTMQTIRRRSLPVKPSSLTLTAKRRGGNSRGSRVLILKKPGEEGGSEDGETNSTTKMGQGRNLQHRGGIGSCEDCGDAEDNDYQG
ncbi:hypothetical protein BKA70DRAFT_1221002 [Coprinopsis sp. MPI-PUGE-AT-0042]|nr:hypothetical protein BKA70DRAFT_1221002 [Coprinopsis sp. MPI-PUGE-AT-0042]